MNKPSNVNDGLTTHSTPSRITNLKLPECSPVIGESVRQADIDLLSCAPAHFLDTTHFDTVRFPPPPWALEIFVNAASNGSYAYTPYRGDAHVLDSVAKATSSFLNIPVNPNENILLTPGTQAGLFAVLASCIEPKQPVAVFDPDYLFTARILRFFDSDIAYIPLIKSDAGLSPNLDVLENEFANNGVRTLVFSHPNNPTGAVYSAETIKAIAKLAQQYNVLVIVDELYSRLIYEGVSFPHLAAEPGMAQQVVTLLGPSKTESLSGYRLGVVIGPADIIDRAENVLSITSLRAPAYSQHLLKSWLRDDKEWLQERLEEFANLREMTVETFGAISWINIEAPKGTAYLWVDISALNLPDPIIFKRLLKEAGVLVSPGYQFGPSGIGHFRVCFARDEQEWDKAMQDMLNVLNDIKETYGIAPGKAST